MVDVQKITEKYFEMENGRPKIVEGKPVILEGLKVDDYTVEAREVLHKNIEWTL